MKIFLTLFVLFFSSSVLAEGINLVCTSNTTYDYKTKKTTTSESTFSFYVRQGVHWGGDFYYFDTTDFCGNYFMTIEPTLISGNCSYTNSVSEKVDNHLRIDRFSGETTILSEVDNKSTFLRLAECKKDEKLF